MGTVASLKVNMDQKCGFIVRAAEYILSKTILC